MDSGARPDRETTCAFEGWLGFCTTKRTVKYSLSGVPDLLGENSGSELAIYLPRVAKPTDLDSP